MSDLGPDEAPTVSPCPRPFIYEAGLKQEGQKSLAKGKGDEDSVFIITFYIFKMYIILINHLLSEEKSSDILMMICVENLAKFHVQYTINRSQR